MATATAPNAPAENLDLAYLDNPFLKADEPESTGGSVPAGKYTGILDEVELKRSQSGNLGLSQKLKITEGDYAGRFCFRWNTVPERSTERTKANQQLGFLKRDLKVYGVNPDAESFSLNDLLKNKLGTLLDAPVEITVKYQEGNQNPSVYINKLPGVAGDKKDAASSGKSSTGSAGAASSAPKPNDEAYDPFADE